jgi:hypothetical protein
LLKSPLLDTMVVDMSTIREMNKPGGDKIGLLGLFALTLLLARFTVTLKSVIRLSEPIPLPYSGLSVSMPVGNGWDSKKRWMYYDNALILSSIFMPRPNGATAWAHCQYRWGAKAAAPQDRFAWKASEVDGEIVETGRTEVDALTVDWVHIERADLLFTTFWGTAGLPNDRLVDIEVHQVMSDPELAKRVFNRIVNKLSFEEAPLLDAGADVVTTIKREGLDRSLDNRTPQVLYLIKDAAGQSVGFTMEVLAEAAGDARWNVRGASVLYMQGRNPGQEETSFRCSNHLDAFTYSSRVYSREGRGGTEIVLGASGAMTVRRSGPQMEVKEYYPGSAAMPDVLFDHIFRRMLDSGRREIVVDLIDVSGKIIPTYIGRIEAGTSQAAYVFDLEFLDGSGFMQRVYLDAQRQIYKSLVRQDDSYILERTSRENIIREFPGHARQILRDNRLL